ncbi:response regulator [Roseospira navarrensis]|nr:response regulator [Roseospira navarrensis]
MASVLVVEDDGDLRAVLARALHRAGHDVTEAADGAIALARLDQGDSFDLILTDLEMPGRSGLEVIAAGKRAGRARPVIAMSGKGRPIGVGLDIARRAGADAVLAKPFRLSAMRGLAERLLAGRRPPRHSTQQTWRTLPMVMPPDLLGAKVGRAAG